MSNQLSREEFLRNLNDSGLLSKEELSAAVGTVLDASAATGKAVAQRLIAAGKLTAFQAEAVSARQFEGLVIGNYLVLDRLGAGGMGTVYKARHRRMKRVVALKVLSRSVAQSVHFVQRFQREVEAVARLSHPNIVMAFDADEADVGHFLVMEFVNGRDLASEVEQRGPLQVQQSVDCALQAARALDYAHRQGIIHRDIKPANLLRDVSGVVKVADLGLARFNDTLARPSEPLSGLTQAGTIMGTVDFMPPEQALGMKAVDERADIYSLGCSLFFLLTGRPPYQGPTLMAILLQHRDAPIPSLCAARSGVPAALDQAFRRMVAKKPDDRFASMAEVVAALEGIGVVPDLRAQQPAASSVLGAESVAGATVEFVPDQPCRTPDVVAPVVPTITEASASRATAGERAILLVEPSRSQAVIIRGYLQKLGFSDVATATSGQNALDAAGNVLPSVVISAMHLADMTGVQLAQQLRSRAPLSSVGFVLITSEDEAREATSLSHAADVVRLRKPFDLDHLAQALAAATGGPPQQARPADPDALARLRLLLVDDSAAARAHVRSVLTGLGLRQIVEATDGTEAVAVLARGPVDLVVTDYNMPCLDGRGLIDFIRHRSATPDLPVIVVTTETDPSKLAAVRQLGVSAVCDKSFPPATVRSIIGGLLRAP